MIFKTTGFKQKVAFQIRSGLTGQVLNEIRKPDAAQEAQAKMAWAQAFVVRGLDKQGFSTSEVGPYNYARKALFEDGSKGTLYFRDEAQSEKLLGPTAATIKRREDDAAFAKDDAIRKKRGSSGDIFTTPLGQIGGRAAANALLG